MIARTVVVPDPLAKANVMAALAGHGAPAGVTACTADGPAITVRFDDERTAPVLIEAIIEVAIAFVPAAAAPIGDPARAAAIAARGLGEPALDAGRIIETYLA